MNPQTLAPAIADHISDRQDPPGVPVSQTNQIDAAALDGARSIDAAAIEGQQSGALIRRSITSSDVFDRLAQRFTQSLACVHLTARPVQPRYIYGAARKRVFCRECLTTFLLYVGEAIRAYDASTECDACGSETDEKEIHVGNISNGLVTYIVRVCSDCLGPTS